MVPQAIPSFCTHSYFTFAVNYGGEAARSVSWKDFYDRYKAMGGDGFYAAWSVPYLEPALQNRIYAGRVLGPGLCPQAEALQRRLMQFKTNYRDLDVAERKAAILSDLIDSIGR